MIRNISQKYKRKKEGEMSRGSDHTVLLLLLLLLLWRQCRP
jgi:hypothetical protein